MGVAVIIPAAGEGKRLGGHRKQFRALGGLSVLEQTVMAFERHPEIDHIIVATPTDAVDPLEQQLRRIGTTKLWCVVEGGCSRQESVFRALVSIPGHIQVVLVHDAVRPFVSADAITELVRRVRSDGAAALAVPVSDTLRRASENTFGDTVERDGLFRMQTPQGFRRDWFREAHEAARNEGLEWTDDVALVQWAGHEVHCVPGSADNVKITTPSDWERAQRMWPVWTQEHV
ncbi:MAG: 2-C-methyl-D-erythritol 4-phosphate cytidylyltransferase [Bacteroidetes bacterium CG12_big_fil_rev_8_21_14_0_65_60_17]|nr:MAG: 2-C-methyl-D-erythritol 4-phosphate cytidylyltransferase [Bacteroidetes bacterium CG12_big_fil_rev_8_21_14_0_65_60_17]